MTGVQTCALPILSEVMEKDLVIVRENEKLNRVFEFFSTYDFLIYPIVNSANKLTGIIRLEDLRAILKEQNCWQWILAKDVSVPLKENIFTFMSLKQALRRMAEFGMQQIPVVESSSLKPVGILDIRKAEKIVEEKCILQEIRSGS